MSEPTTTTTRTTGDVLAEVFDRQTGDVAGTVAVDSGCVLFVDPAALPAELLARLLAPHPVSGIALAAVAWTPHGDGLFTVAREDNGDLTVLCGDEPDDAEFGPLSDREDLYFLLGPEEARTLGGRLIAAADDAEPYSGSPLFPGPDLEPFVTLGVTPARNAEDDPVRRLTVTPLHATGTTLIDPDAEVLEVLDHARAVAEG